MFVKMAVHHATHSAIAAHTVHEVDRESRRRVVRLARRTLLKKGKTTPIKSAHGFTPRVSRTTSGYRSTAQARSGAAHQLAAHAMVARGYAGRGAAYGGHGGGFGASSGGFGGGGGFGR